MTPPYSTAQLAFFRNTLKLLETAIFESLLHVSETINEAQASLSILRIPRQ